MRSCKAVLAPPAVLVLAALAGMLGGVAVGACSPALLKLYGNVNEIFGGWASTSSPAA